MKRIGAFRRTEARGAAGFTLIEVLVALSIIAYALIGLLGLQNRNLTILGRSQDISRATLLARKFIAEMEVREKFPDIGYSSGELEPGFFWEREVTETIIPEVREVRLRIIFDERQPDLVELLYYMRDRFVPEEIQ
jgi:general secretion pathway protein I